MKKYIYLSLFALLFVGVLQAQVVYDSIALGADYANQSYYSLDQGEVANVNNQNWDLAFDASTFGSAIRVNGQAGVKLFVTASDLSEWATFDSTSVGSWMEYNNADTSWSLGAFNRGADMVNPLDVGWGGYNPINHNITGDSIYVVEFASGARKKLSMDRLGGGKYYFRYANLDGSNEITDSLAKADFVGKNFGYYSLQNESELDREPASIDWDIVFTKYLGEIAPNFYYGVTGALSNTAVIAAEATPVNDPHTYTQYASHTFYSEINTIGYDWKTFNSTTFQYELDDSLCYFVQDVSGDIWRLVFTAFEGGSTGKIVFSRELLSGVGFGEAGQAVSPLTVYPNPASDELNYLFENAGEKTAVSIFDMTGKVVYQEKIYQTGFQVHTLALNTFPSGVYGIQLTIGETVSTQKFIVQ